MKLQATVSHLIKDGGGGEGSRALAGGEGFLEFWVGKCWLDKIARTNPPGIGRWVCLCFHSFVALRSSSGVQEQQGKLL